MGTMRKTRNGRYQDFRGYRKGDEKDTLSRGIHKTHSSNLRAKISPDPRRGEPTAAQETNKINPIRGTGKPLVQVAFYLWVNWTIKT
jgi:hypothetical protein